MQRRSAVVAGIILVIGLCYAGLALNSPRGTLAQPGAGIYTLLTGSLLVVSAAGMLWQAVLACAPLPTLP
jgi:hypothetical protein